MSSKSSPKSPTVLTSPLKVTIVIKEQIGRKLHKQGIGRWSENGRVCVCLVIQGFKDCEMQQCTTVLHARLFKEN